MRRNADERYLPPDADDAEAAWRDRAGLTGSVDSDLPVTATMFVGDYQSAVVEVEGNIVIPVVEMIAVILVPSVVMPSGHTGCGRAQEEQAGQ